MGVSPIAWTNDDLPSLGGDTPLEVCLSEAAAVGFSGVELGGKFPRDPETLRAVLAAHGLALVSGWYGAHLLEREAEEELELMRPHCLLLRALGCDVVVFAELSGSVHADQSLPMSARPSLDAEGFSRLAGKLNHVATGLEEHGLRLAYHHHAGTVVDTAGDIDALLQHCDDRVGLAFDTGHLTVAGADVAALARTYGERVLHVHLKDVRAEVLADAQARDRSFLDAVADGIFTVPGDGAVDFTPILAALRQADYSGWLVIEAEQDPRRAEPRRYAQLGLYTVARVLRAVGWQ